MTTAINAAIVLLIALTGWIDQDAEAPKPETVPPQDSIRRIAIIGASASAGFGVVVEQADVETGQYAKTMMNMKDLLVHADDPAELVYLDLSSHLFFSRPRSFARSAVDRVLEWKPDLVFAVDFLFWFTYGVIAEERRLAFLEVGLQMLEEIASRGIPVVIGELPDLEGTESFVISERQIPLRTTVVEANQRINAWAAERTNVAVVPLQALTDQLSRGEAITVGSHQWDPGKDGISMIAVDKLHPTFDGMICLVQAMEAAARSIEESGNGLPPLTLDRDALMKRMRVRRLAPRRRTKRKRESAQLSDCRRLRSRFRSRSVVASSNAARIDARAA